MTWTLDNSKVKYVNDLTTTEQNNLTLFTTEIDLNGTDPKNAAAAWNSNYKKLGGTKNQFEIYLSHNSRATFSVDGVNKVVTMLAVGGHT